MAKETYTKEEVQKLIDMTYRAAILLKDYPDFYARSSRENLEEWVRINLRDAGFNTVAMGMCFGVLQ